MDLSKHRQKLHSLALRILRNPDDAEDAVQDVFVKALSSGFEGRSSVYTWLYRITYNECVTRLRANGKTLPPSDEHAPAPDELLELRGQAVSLEGAVRRLPPMLEAPVRLRLEGMDYQRIADELGVPLNTAKSRLRRAKQALSKELLSEQQ